MGSSEHNRRNISSLTGGKMLNFGMKVFCILFFLNVMYNKISFLKNQIFVTSSLWYSTITCGKVNKNNNNNNNNNYFTFKYHFPLLTISIYYDFFNNS